MDELALEVTLPLSGPPAWAVGQAASYLWRQDLDEDVPIPCVNNLRGLQSLWIKIGTTRCRMQIGSSAAE